jgi:hypothetical protein
MKYIIECSEKQTQNTNGITTVQDVLQYVFILNEEPEKCKEIGRKLLTSVFSLEKFDEKVFIVTATPLGEYCDNLLKLGANIQKRVNKFV